MVIDCVLQKAQLIFFYSIPGALVVCGATPKTGLARRRTEKQR